MFHSFRCRRTGSFARRVERVSQCRSRADLYPGSEKSSTTPRLLFAKPTKQPGKQATEQPRHLESELAYPTPATQVFLPAHFRRLRSSLAACTSHANKKARKRASKQASKQARERH
mmetsp:Transcript_11933/g.23401  ORF Transcript_11933/g.23401 Transcript_11933/m.23401 type:complete len:116 (+) Transcript_11933:3765-4112(+)